MTTPETPSWGKNYLCIQHDRELGPAPATRIRSSRLARARPGARGRRRFGRRILAADLPPVWKSKFYGAFVLNHRVVLHAIDATPARWRDACSMAWRCRFLAARRSQDGRVIAEKRLGEELSVQPTHRLISTQCHQRSSMAFAAEKLIEPFFLMTSTQNNSS